MTRMALALTVVMGFGLAGCAASSAEAAWPHGYQGYNGGCLYQGRTYSTYRPRGHYDWHDTSHYDWHPGHYRRHGNHYDYVPGHYDLHRTGHWDYHRGSHRNNSYYRGGHHFHH